MIWLEEFQYRHDEGMFRMKSLLEEINQTPFCRIVHPVLEKS